MKNNQSNSLEAVYVVMLQNDLNVNVIIVDFKKCFHSADLGFISRPP